jgi:hypothetical protein
MTSPVILIHIILCLWCALFAFVLSRRAVYDWYHPDWTWFIVLLGVGFIGLAQKAIIDSGTPLTFLLIFTTDLAAGIPIIVWQVAEWVLRIIDRKKGR